MRPSSKDFSHKDVYFSEEEEEEEGAEEEGEREEDGASQPFVPHKADESEIEDSGADDGEAIYLTQRKRKSSAMYLRFFILGLACFASAALTHIIDYARFSSSVSPSPISPQRPAGAMSFSPIIPPAYPLAVRNPYLSAWLPGSAAESLPFARPQFWAGQELNWAILARVDNKTYSLFGVPYPYGFRSEPALVLGGHYTSTRTIFDLKAGNVQFSLEFFSPVSPKNYLRQSLPFSYLTISATVLDGKKTSIQVYSDIDESWTGQAGETIYNFKTTGNTSMYQLGVRNAFDYSDKSEMALWGLVVWAATNTSQNLHYAVGPVQDIRGQFARDGFLRGDRTGWAGRGIQGFTPRHTVAAFTHDLGLVQDEASCTFTIGYVREKAIDYLGEPQTHFYRGKYPETLAAVNHFLEDYEAASRESMKLDRAIEEAGIAAGGQKYADILALSMRQIMGAVDITIPHGDRDQSNPYVFVKECSSNGNVNTLDITYPAFPVFYLLNPEIIRLMLEPVIKYLNTGRYAENFTIHDIGSHYPNATGHDAMDEEQMPIEECGNLLILANAYTRASKNSSWVDKHFPLLQGYADYIVENGLYPPFQLSTNDAIGPIGNQTNLAIKAAVALAAWGNLTSQANYTATGRSFAKTIYKIGTDTNQTYFKLAYDRDSWFLVFNLYPDKLLSLDTFPPEAHQMASDYHSVARGSAGVALGGDFKWAKTDWQLFAAGAADDATVRQMFIDDLWEFITNGLNIEAFSDRYWVDDDYMEDIFHFAGSARDFMARPTLGAHFAILAREVGGVLDWDV